MLIINDLISLLELGLFTIEAHKVSIDGPVDLLRSLLIAHIHARAHQTLQATLVLIHHQCTVFLLLLRFI